MAGGIEAIAASISADLIVRLPRQDKKQREGLALLTASPPREASMRRHAPHGRV